MKKEKVIKATNVGELFHHYANSTFDKDTRGDYSYEGNFFYIGSTVFAKIISHKKKILVVQPFDRIGAYHRGYSVQSLKHAFNKDWTIIEYDILIHLPNELKDYTKEDFLKLALYNLKESVLDKVNNYVLDKYIITNQAIFAKIGTWNRSENFDNILDQYINKFKVSKSKILKHIYNETHYITVAYNGWGSKTEEKYKIDKPISFYLDDTKWHTKEEQHILDFKAWKQKHFNNVVTINRYGKTYLEIYNNPILKLAFEESSAKGIIKHEAEMLLKRKDYEAKELIRQESLLNKWLAGESINNLWSIPIHLRIKNNRIETTRNAIIPFESGKKLFKLFNKIRQDSTILIYGAKDDEKTVGQYQFRNIEHIDEHWYITVGCHQIRDTEIDLFIKTNNLNEW